ncbi:hypothetical protein OLX02_10855 [Novosphingobium sp. KCTC 2891]|uniref:CC_3452 family protein n=1 Tax=Novosphingobium sp. KCTC 2891 TaxID=2989730 RepID=UPI0022234F36|nr:hypothetical protein [Novosphingobium sp. KCTC 2891]MCW1383323.1 hypothetical protein [Novosphingobium sp. KCTC 2891]
MIARHNGALRQLVPALLALAGTVATFGATATPSHAATGYYSVTLAAPLASPKRFVDGETPWSCTGAECTAPRNTSRPAIVCARVAKKVGAVTRFATPEGEMTAEDLAKCNGTH